MFIDESLEIADGSDPAAGASTKVGTHIDLRPVGVSDNATVDLSAGEPIYFVLEVVTTFTEDNADCSYKFTLVTDSATDLVTSPVNIFTTGFLDNGTTFTAGQRWIVSLPEAGYKRYLGLLGESSGTGDVTGGAFNAFLTKDVSNWTSTDTRVNV